MARSESNLRIGVLRWRSTETAHLFANPLTLPHPPKLRRRGRPNGGREGIVELTVTPFLKQCDYTWILGHVREVFLENTPTPHCDSDSY